MVSQSGIYNGHDGGVCRTQPRHLGVCTSQIQPLMSRLTAVMTQVIKEDSGGEDHAVADTATEVTPGIERGSTTARPATTTLAWT